MSILWQGGGGSGGESGVELVRGVVGCVVTSDTAVYCEAVLTIVTRVVVVYT